MSDQPTTATPEHDHTRTLDLDGFGTATAQIRCGTTGPVVYAITAPHVHGAVTVDVNAALHTDVGELFSFAYGIAADDAHNWDYAQLLTVHNVRLVGTHTVTARGADSATRFTLGSHMVQRDTPSGPDSSVPKATTARTLALLTAILSDFAARDDLPARHRAAAIRDAPLALPHHRALLTKKDNEIARLQAQRDTIARRINVLEVIASAEDWTETPRQMLGF